MNFTHYALVANADEGSGYAVAQQLLQAGYFVFLGCGDATRGHRTRLLLQAAGFPRVMALELDVADDRSVLRAIEVVYQHAPHLNALVNNAGVLSPDPLQPPSLIPLRFLQTVFNTNYYGVIRTTQAFLPLLQLASHACIVNVSSDLGSLTRQAGPAWECSADKPVAYSTSQVMLNAWTVLLAHELRDTTIKVNAVAPDTLVPEAAAHPGVSPTDQAAQVILHYATLPLEGPTGQFFSEAGPIPW